MDREEFQKKYDSSILVCCTENSINKVFNICDLMDLTVSKSKQITAILIGEQTAKSPLFHVEQFLNDFYNEVGATKKKIIHKYNNFYIRKVLSIGFGNKKMVMVDEEDFHVFLKALYYLYKCNEWIKKDDEKNKEQPKEPVFNKGNKIIYTIKDSNGNTYPVTRLSERVYESKEHKTLFITDEEGTVTGIYKEK